MAKSVGGTAAGGSRVRLGAGGAVGALLLAAAVLTAGALAPGAVNGRPTDERVVPGKVSVLGDAKVRRWTGRTFSIEVPLEWANIRIRGQREYVWALTPHHATLTQDDVKTAADEDWSVADKVVSARVRVSVGSASVTKGARSAALALSRNSTRFTDGFVDRGPIEIVDSTGAAKSRYAWRLEVAADKTIESHYFFTTCDHGVPSELWHLTVNRSKQTGKAAATQKATIDAMLASFQTVHQASPGGKSECPAAA